MPKQKGTRRNHGRAFLSSFCQGSCILSWILDQIMDTGSEISFRLPVSRIHHPSCLHRLTGHASLNFRRFPHATHKTHPTRSS
jgi:hypothetical protein